MILYDIVKLFFNKFLLYNTNNFCTYDSITFLVGIHNKAKVQFAL
jgi:hypothetical protein